MKEKENNKRIMKGQVTILASIIGVVVAVVIAAIMIYSLFYPTLNSMAPEMTAISEKVALVNGTTVSLSKGGYGIIANTVSLTNSDGTITYVEGQNYTVDYVAGKITFTDIEA